ncbi:phage holin [Pediococcus pentosaceus]|uniref:phage holin n=1 Tax=Pediococcus pentosaceus TaxID=1255 RepID=UPI002FBE4B7F
MNLSQTLNNVYALIVLGGFLATIFGYLNPLLKQKIAKEKNLRVKSRYELLDQWAENAVAQMSALSDMIGQDKKAEAMRMVNGQLKAHNIDIDVEHVSAAVEKAVQQLSANGGNHQNDNIVDTTQQVLDHLDAPEVPDEEPAKEA